MTRSHSQPGAAPSGDDVSIGPARAEDCDDVAAMVQELARDTDAALVPKATGDDFRSHAIGADALLSLTVARGPSGLLGYCLSTQVFSTWRGAFGSYVIDLYIRPGARRGKLGERLLAHVLADAEAHGCRFAILDVDNRNHAADRFYGRLGFRSKSDEHRLLLDAEAMRALAARARSA